MTLKEIYIEIPNNLRHIQKANKIGKIESFFEDKEGDLIPVKKYILDHIQKQEPNKEIEKISYFFIWENVIKATLVYTQWFDRIHIC